MILGGLLKLFKQIRATGVRLSGISADSVLMKEISCLDRHISQIQKMGKFKPDDKKLPEGIAVLDVCKQQILNAIESPAPQLSQVDASERPSFNRGPN